MTTWNEARAAALATVEDALQKLADVKRNLEEDEDLKSAILEVGEEDVAIEFDDEADEDKATALETTTDALDAAQADLAEIARALVSGHEEILKHL